jgi:hypothetical protein
MAYKMIYIFGKREWAEKRWNDLNRLGHRPFSIFQTSDGGWAFWVR